MEKNVNLKRVVYKIYKCIVEFKDDFLLMFIFILYKLFWENLIKNCVYLKVLIFLKLNNLVVMIFCK